MSEVGIDLSGRTMLLTGGLGVLAQSITTRLKAAGAVVVLNDVRPADPPLGLPVVVGDAAAAGAAARILDESTELAGSLPDTLLLHAGITVTNSVLDQRIDDLQAMWSANVVAGAALAQEAARRWIELDMRGLLVWTSSWVQDVPWPGIAGYSATKAALRMMARSFARELAPHGIRSNVLAPGIVGAGMAKIQWDTEPDYRARAQRAVPLGELQSPDSVADTMLYLVSDLAAYMTGSVVTVDGGADLYPMD